VPSFGQNADNQPDVRAFKYLQLQVRRRIVISYNTLTVASACLTSSTPSGDKGSCGARGYGLAKRTVEVYRYRPGCPNEFRAEACLDEVDALYQKYP
jgi:hypothetical protein